MQQDVAAKPGSVFACYLLREMTRRHQQPSQSKDVRICCSFQVTTIPDDFSLDYGKQGTEQPIDYGYTASCVASMQVHRLEQWLKQ